MSTHSMTKPNIGSSDAEIGNAPSRRMAQYVRMSTEHQQYSTENQSDAIAQYALEHNMEIVRTYADAGKSGLSIEGRPGLKQLIGEITAGNAPFDGVLVYDVSRWGRFQDADESAYHEYICKRAGVPVTYCAEQFTNDGSPMSTVMKSMKRGMAAEYSRELSTKVFKGQCRLIEMGFRQGGPAGYGLRRMLVSASGTQKGELGRGQHKSLQTDRVILVPGPSREIKIVRRIYRMFVAAHLSERAIAIQLNDEGAPAGEDEIWTRGRIHQVLTNEKYIGNNIFNRVSFKLKQKRVTNLPDQWVRKNGAFDAIVGDDDFYTARGLIEARTHRLTDEELLEQLRALAQRRDEISGLIIDEEVGMPSSSIYRNRFGSLLRAYRLVGYTPDRDYTYLEVNRQLREMHPTVVADVVLKLKGRDARVEPLAESGMFRINESYNVSIVLARCRTTGTRYKWHIRLDRVLQPDITIAIRMNPTNTSILDYYVLPNLDRQPEHFRIKETNKAMIDAYRYDNLEHFLSLAEEVAILEAA